LSVDLLQRRGGAFGIATVVDLGTTQPRGTPPETEDQLFDPNQVTVVRELTPGRFWNLLKAVSQRRLTDVFGHDLKAQRSGCAVDEGTGIASLGCVRPLTRPKIFINGWGKIRASVSDGSFDVDLSVTDARLYKDDQQTPRTTLVAEVQRRIGRGVGVMLSVGLARAFQVSGDTARRHWLQVNNIHLEDDPTWKGA
jgi:hypothetical protein